MRKQSTDHLIIFFTLGLAYTSINPDPNEATTLFNLFVYLRMSSSLAVLGGDRTVEFCAELGSLGVLVALGVKTLYKLVGEQ